MRKLLFLIMLISAPAYAEEKIDCDKAAATMEILNCGLEEFKKLEKEREELEEKVIQNAKRWDKILIEEGHEGYAENEKSARMSKKAFEEYRRAECGRQEVYAGLGSIRRVIGRHCINNFTRERIKLLQQVELQRH